MSRIICSFVAIALLSLPRQARAQDSAAVVTVVQQLFDGMASRDTALLRKILLPGASIVSLGSRSGAPNVTMRTDADFVKGMGSGTDKLLERIWTPTVMIRNAIATLWAPYDFHINGKFSHCGIDAFSLLKTADGWRIANITYTSERTGCEPSPLGEVK
jgi:hypothetical protein